MNMTAEQGIYFLGLLLIAGMFLGIGYMAASCAWCAWRDRWWAKGS